jgi:hypothetical protein
MTMFQAHAVPHSKRDNQHSYRFVAIMIILVLILAACGGGASDTDEGDGGDANTAVEAVDKGTITYGQTVEDTLVTDPAHRYQFTGANGHVLQIRLIATGSTFYAPYGFVYGADEALLVSSDTARRARSENLNITLTADGTYTLVLQPPGDTVPGGYSVTIEKTE